MSEEKKFERAKPMNPGDEAPQRTTGAGENICGDCRGTGKREGKFCQTCGGIGRVIEGIGGA
jgi:hypothetical protein